MRRVTRMARALVRCPRAARSLTSALSHVQAGTGDVRRMLGQCTFRPRLPGERAPASGTLHGCAARRGVRKQGLPRLVRMLCVPARSQNTATHARQV
jgi:hypothetical protein